MVLIYYYHFEKGLRITIERYTVNITNIYNSKSSNFKAFIHTDWLFYLPEDSLLLPIV